MVEVIDHVTCPIEKYEEVNDIMNDSVVSLLFNNNERELNRDVAEIQDPIITFKKILVREVVKPKTEIKDSTEVSDETNVQVSDEDKEFREASIQQSIDRLNEIEEKYKSYEDQITKEEVLLYLNNPEDWKYHQLEKFSNEYRDSVPLKVSCHTYNIDQNIFEPNYLEPWLIVDFDSDIVVASVQELDMSATGIVAGRGITEKGTIWKNNLFETLKKKGNYHFVKMEQLCGIVIFMFAKPEIVPLMKNIETSWHAVGKMGLANKGGVAIRFDMNETRFCFVNSHLAAHQQFLDKRNGHWKMIWEELKFKKCKIVDHDYIIWMGDLNYRIEMEDSVVRDLMYKGELDTLYAKDQLNTSKAKGIVFYGFKEAPIHFIPTFKIICGKDEYIDDRIPAWCDRVLCRTQNAYPYEVCNYTSHNLLLSDHKPVSCCFTLYPSKTLPDKLEEVNFKIWKMTDYIEKKLTPYVEIDKTELYFEQIELSQTYNQIIKIKNIGEYPTRFEFSQRPDSKLVCPTYYVISPQDGLLQPGEEQNVKVTLFIQPEQAMIVCKKTIIDVFSLSFAYGGIHFITSKIDIVDSIFGKDLKTVTSMKDPYQSVEGSITTGLINQQIPKEIWRLGSDIISEIKADTLIQHPTEVTVREVLHSINTNSRYTTKSASAMLQGLSYFLMALPDSLIPSSRFYDVTTCKTKVDAYAVVNSLPNENYSLFFYITVLIRQIVESINNKTITLQTVCDFFSRLILRHPTSSVIIKENIERISNFLMNFVDI
ncbi:inositol polyphosphate 5-phosphatase, putative [Entamoeba histolytica HM-1:IMSS-B]|uniref:Inositol polyphosphate 5-phosphatase, putative n=6 Tax=Entamoeba histolytica TaxID=5759 RepID=C4LSE0_ENTH1|nr:inositol polyphosphate 5-phosphatase, putative [Entamoeba histolytica HM-1:IMSS]EMD42907.1 inositol polyphosphate 5-phosphatase, putative [Entamoeba histolytica KU27]EMH73228.1 inositol polyphosphate 5-phosphatase, putative [Entamoeba histolytica HM-1:IMSS-B]EMS17095.1 inositol polyphosphate 5-phosphatase, putative [Entamoeba histolytica HM-3:IMSS]ENY61293.1 inositol polyphosphate 5-phosphatase, putative [Entamoeba histolytica HM-1:IMSS-A]GAT91606.1 inositol polyphosphate 5-phosphatase puta|eukprot:XP_656367.1 inositol polyphosphate 5-phosphatase, putative [Entamoeba histolytica HM-1:IMSS]